MLVAPNNKKQTKSNAQLERPKIEGEEDQITTTSLPGDDEEDSSVEIEKQPVNL